jgi:hypothetical protein
MNRSRLRATSVSVAAHSAVFAILLVGIDDDGAERGRQTIIYAELLQLDDSSAPAGESPSEGRNDERSEEPRASDEPRPAAEPPTIDEPLTVAEPRVIDEPRTVDEPTPSAPETTVMRVDEIAPAAATPALDVPQPSTHPAIEPAQPDLPNTPVEADTAVADLSAIAEEPSADPVSPRPRTVPVSDPQRLMLSTKFASWTERFTPDQSEPTAVWEHDGRKYAAVFRQISAVDSMGMEHLQVEISTEENGNRVSTELRMKRMAFSNFAQFVDQWDPQVRIHDDEVDGRFHSNSEIHLLSNRDAKPVFHGRVTTASRRVNTDAPGRVYRDRMFLGGLETGVRTIMLPKQFVPFPRDTAVADDQIQRFEQDTRLTFYSDGTYRWQDLDSAEPERVGAVSGDAYYMVAAEDKALHIKGTVNGKVLVYSPERIVIEDDLMYARDPGTVGADDYLGLVSDKSVEIAGPGVTGSGDLRIHASIYAKRRFVVRNYRSKASGTLHIYGSLIAGSVTATEPRFATKIEFDRRLDNVRPPSFPLTDRYELQAWDGAWTIDDVD